MPMFLTALFPSDSANRTLHVVLFDAYYMPCPPHPTWTPKELAYIMWHADPLLGNDREISKHTTAVAR
jgi:hypothetical protein